MGLPGNAYVVRSYTSHPFCALLLDTIYLVASQLHQHAASWFIIKSDVEEHLQSLDFRSHIILGWSCVQDACTSLFNATSTLWYYEHVDNFTEERGTKGHASARGAFGLVRIHRLSFLLESPCFAIHSSLSV